MRTVKATIAYKGTQFCGWQTQPKDRTAQQVLTDALKLVISEDIAVLGASRTDSGVHAEGQVVALQFDTEFPLSRFCSVVNRVLPPDICVIDAEEVDNDFHPIACAISKIYHYKISNSKTRDPFQAELCWENHRHLNLDRMKQAAAYFVGTHDFSAFCATGSNAKSKVRSLYQIDIRGEAGGDIVIAYHGNGFLYNMVRILTAVLEKVGIGYLSPEQAKAILEGKDRSKAPWTAPAHGLYLHKIFYSEAEESEYFQGTKNI